MPYSRNLDLRAGATRRGSFFRPDISRGQGFPYFDKLSQQKELEDQKRAFDLANILGTLQDQRTAQLAGDKYSRQFIESDAALAAQDAIRKLAAQSSVNIARQPYSTNESIANMPNRYSEAIAWMPYQRRLEDARARYAGGLNGKRHTLPDDNEIASAISKLGLRMKTNKADLKVRSGGWKFPLSSYRAAMNYLAQQPKFSNLASQMTQSAAMRLSNTYWGVPQARGGVGSRRNMDWYGAKAREPGNQFVGSGGNFMGSLYKPLKVPQGGYPASPTTQSNQFLRPFIGGGRRAGNQFVGRG